MAYPTGTQNNCLFSAARFHCMAAEVWLHRAVVDLVANVLAQTGINGKLAGKKHNCWVRSTTLASNINREQESQ